MAGASVAIVSVLAVILLFPPCQSGPPQVERRPLLLDSYLPAAMQVIAHVTELMKYDMKPKPATRPPPTIAPGTRPTPPHRPGVYSPNSPPGPGAYEARIGLIDQDVLQNVDADEVVVVAQESNGTQATRPIYSPVFGQLPPAVEEYISKNVLDLLRDVNYAEDDTYSPALEEQNVLEFTKKYEDDTDVRYILLKQKKVPPTKAYVSLLILYDMLNKETKKLQFNKYGGYAQQILNQLIQNSRGTSASQLRFVLGKVLERRDTKVMSILTKIEKLIVDLDEENSYINAALRDIPPLYFRS